MLLGSVISTLFIAFITGALARFALPGPDPQQFERSRHEAMLRELHRAGLLEDDELQEKLERLGAGRADT
jgi:hypothetical protein